METQMLNVEFSDEEEDTASNEPFAHLVVTDDGSGMDTQEVFPLIAGAITVGRLKESDLQIDHASVSGRHATIEKFGETWTIKDGCEGKKSSNGIFVRGARVAADTFGDGDAVCFGKVATVFQVGSAPRWPATASGHGSNSSSMPATPAGSKLESRNSPTAAKAATPQASKSPYKSVLDASSDDEEGGSGSDTECEEEVIVVSTAKTSPSASVSEAKANGSTAAVAAGGSALTEFTAAPSPFQAALSPVGSPGATQAEEGGSDTECEEDIVETEAGSAAKAPEQGVIDTGLAEDEEGDESKHAVAEASPAEALSANEEMVTQRQSENGDDGPERDPASVPTPMTAEKLPESGGVRFDDAATQAYEPLEDAMDDDDGATEEGGDDAGGDDGKRSVEASDQNETQAFAMATDDGEENGGSDATQVFGMPPASDFEATQPYDNAPDEAGDGVQTAATAVGTERGADDGAAALRQDIVEQATANEQNTVPQGNLPMDGDATDEVTGAAPMCEAATQAMESVIESDDEEGVNDDDGSDDVDRTIVDEEEEDGGAEQTVADLDTTALDDEEEAGSATEGEAEEDDHEGAKTAVSSPSVAAAKDSTIEDLAPESHKAEVEVAAKSSKLQSPLPVSPTAPTATVATTPVAAPEAIAMMATEAPSPAAAAAETATPTQDEENTTSAPSPLPEESKDADVAATEEEEEEAKLAVEASPLAFTPANEPADTTATDGKQVEAEVVSKAQSPLPTSPHVSSSRGAAVSPAVAAAGTADHGAPTELVVESEHEDKSSTYSPHSEGSLSSPSRRASLGGAGCASMEVLSELHQENELHRYHHEQEERRRQREEDDDEASAGEGSEQEEAASSEAPASPLIAVSLPRATASSRERPKRGRAPSPSPDAAAATEEISPAEDADDAEDAAAVDAAEDGAVTAEATSDSPKRRQGKAAKTSASASKAAAATLARTLSKRSSGRKATGGAAAANAAMLAALEARQEAEPKPGATAVAADDDAIAAAVDVDAAAAATSPAASSPVAPKAWSRSRRGTPGRGDTGAKDELQADKVEAPAPAAALASESEKQRGSTRGGRAKKAPVSAPPPSEEEHVPTSAAVSNQRGAKARATDATAATGAEKEEPVDKATPVVAGKQKRGRAGAAAAATEVGPSPQSASEEVPLPKRRGKAAPEPVPTTAKGAAATKGAAKGGKRVAAAAATAAAPEEPAAEAAPAPKRTRREGPASYCYSSSSSVAAGPSAPTSGAVNTSSARAAAAAEGPKSSVKAPKVLFTNVEITAAGKKQLASIGASLVDDPRVATHLVCAAAAQQLPFKRSVKVMASLSCGVQHAVDLKWLVESAAAGAPLDEAAYAVQDAAAEAKYGFKMADALASTAKVFQGLAVYCAPAPPGAKVPSPPDLQLIVECAGGKWCATPAAVTKATTTTGGSKGQWAPLVVALPEALAQDAKRAKAWQELAASGPAGHVVTPSWLFDATLRKVRPPFEEYAAAPSATKGSSSKKRGRS